MSHEADPLLACLELVATYRDRSVETRRPVQAVMDAFAGSGQLRLLAPEAYGGSQVSPPEFLSVLERIARVDGSAAWTVMTCNEELGITSAYLPPATVTDLLAEHPNVIVSGSGVPTGRAERVDGGWRFSGRWRFVTGSPCADRIVLAAVVGDPKPSGLCFALFPAADVELEDTWLVAGLRGTGSYDAVLDGAFVADAYAGEAAMAPIAVPDTPFFHLAPGLRFPYPKVGVAVGIATGAIDEFRTLATEKTPTMARASLAERPDAQVAMARAEALVGSGRSFVLDQMAEVWALAEQRRRIPREMHARVRLACSHAVSSCIEAVEALCSAAGTTANFLDSPFQRRLLDVRAVSQHFMVAPYQRDTAGRVLLGLAAGDPRF